jgi:predicted RNA-binding Zn-ribbon protein involved in translation (DUF1610 family)
LTLATTQSVLFFDIELAPLLAYAWRLKTDYINPDAVVADQFVLSWAAKWRGQKKVHSAVLTPEEAQAQDDGRIVQNLSDMVREADVIVAHNLTGFDLPVLRGRVLLLGQEPLGPVSVIDTLKMARQSFNLASNKLDYVAQVLGLLERKDHISFDVWKQAYLGNQRALKAMVKYNRQDVRVLEDVFEALLPHARTVSRLADASREGEMSCPSCGSLDLQRRGVYRTNASTFQRYCCNDCGRWSRQRTAEKNKSSVVPINYG